MNLKPVANICGWRDNEIKIPTVFYSVYLSSCFFIFVLRDCWACLYSCRATNVLLVSFSWVAFWKAAFFFFPLVPSILSLFGLGSLFLFSFSLGFFFHYISDSYFRGPGADYFCSLSLVFILVLIFSSIFVVYIFYECFCLKVLVSTAVMMALWSFHFFPLTPNVPTSSTMVTVGFVMPLEMICLLASFCLCAGPPAFVSIDVYRCAFCSMEQFS